MKVVYNINVDGWTPCQTEHAPVRRGYGPIEISDKVWERLSNKDGPQSGVIPCSIDFTDTEHLVAVARYIEGKL